MIKTIFIKSKTVPANFKASASQDRLVLFSFINMYRYWHCQDVQIQIGFTNQLTLNFGNKSCPNFKHTVQAFLFSILWLLLEYKGYQGCRIELGVNGTTALYDGSY